MKILVIGGGLFGCCSAIELSKSGYTVELIEEQPDIMKLASFVNHNRIHLGYHYLRSIETAEQSIEGLLSFLFNFGDAVVHQFDNYYAIAKDGSKTDVDEFINFCNKVGIGYDEEYPSKTLLDPALLKGCFKVPEPVFDFQTLKKSTQNYLNKNKVKVACNTTCTNIKPLAKGYEAEFNHSEKKEYDVVINSTYASYNKINSMLGIAKKRLLYEDVLIPTFKYKSNKFGLTVMDGPFCSVMPRGKQKNEFLLYHVKKSILNSSLSFDKPEFNGMTVNYEDEIYKASSIFMPMLANVERNGYSRITRVVFENSDDARLTELHKYEGLENYFSILSGKISTCMQVALEIKHIIQNKVNSKRFKI